MPETIREISGFISKSFLSSLFFLIVVSLITTSFIYVMSGANFFVKDFLQLSFPPELELGAFLVYISGFFVTSVVLGGYIFVGFYLREERELEPKISKSIISAVLIVSSIRFLGYPTEIGASGFSDFLTTATVVFPVLASIYFLRELPLFEDYERMIDFISLFGFEMEFWKFLSSSLLVVAISALSAFLIEISILSRFEFSWLFIGPLFVILLFVAGNALGDQKFKQLVMNPNQDSLRKLLEN